MNINLKDTFYLLKTKKTLVCLNKKLTFSVRILNQSNKYWEIIILILSSKKQLY